MLGFDSEDLLLAIALCARFGLFGTECPGLGNLDQYGAIFFRSGARKPMAFGSVIAKFLSVRLIVFRLIVFGINFHIEIRITIDSSTPV
ncbi:MAG TPA: hypothetical protein VKB78_00475 [Pirellulales bacterium]|nr:hypothetical protein [Pirellulales bacterium]